MPAEPAPATRFLLFTGKGGVGKTSHACASAVALADAGRHVLIVSTDPASNLSEVLNAPVGADPVDVPGVPGMRAVNIDPEASAAALRERAVGPMRGILPDDAIRQVEEQLSGACTVEVAAFDERWRWWAPRARSCRTRCRWTTWPTRPTTVAIPGSPRSATFSAAGTFRAKQAGSARTRRWRSFSRHERNRGEARRQPGLSVVLPTARRSTLSTKWSTSTASSTCRAKS
jgi:hypothetical protein